MGIYARRNLVIANFGPNVLLTQPLTNGQILVYDAQRGSFINASNEISSAANLGTGVPVFEEQSGTTLEFNSLVAGENVQITNTDGNITISANSSSESVVQTVPNIAARNALTGLANGALVLVQDTGTGSDQYALYMWLNSTWITIATQDSAETDANTFTYTLNFNSPTTIPLGYISAGHRGVEITVDVVTAFNGLNPSLTIGDAINGPASLMPANLNDLTTAGNYDTEGNFVYAGPNDTLINVYFNSGSSTVGQAIVIVSYV